MILDELFETYAVCKLSTTASIPNWALAGSFFSVSKTPEELSIVCEQNRVPNEIKAERNWRALKVRGPLDFGLTGILAALANPLAEAGISIFAISTFDTDYLLVKSDAFSKALITLSEAGHTIVPASAQLGPMI